MTTFLTQYGWLVIGVVGVGLLSGWAWWLCVDRAKLAARAGFTLVDAEQYKREGEELIALRKQNHEFEREIAAFKNRPIGIRVKPVIDWITLNTVYVDYDSALEELEIGWMDPAKGMGTSTIHDIDEQQARELGEDFKAAIKNRHQPARFA